jgi:DeoR/GlpR family transcriptional regulator of sugar metabolism
MFTFERQDKILKILKKKPGVRVSDLSSSLGVSEATIRRDLNKLHETRQIQRIYGGAILAEKTPPEAYLMTQRATENIEEKSRIGKLAASLVHEGDTVFIGSGTTTQEVARNLAGRQNITVITNAITIINLLYQEEGISLIATGGLLRLSELSFIGHLTESALRELRPQKVFMGIRAISLVEGLTNDYLPEVSTDRLIIQSAPEVILVADHTKFGKVSTALIAPISFIHTLVTDTGIDEEILPSLHGVVKNVLLA